MAAVPAFAQVISDTQPAPTNSPTTFTPGQQLQGGFEFHATNPNPVDTTYEFDNTWIYLPISCTSGGSGSYVNQIRIPIGNQGVFAVPANNTSWQIADANSWQSGVFTVPDLCGGQPMYLTTQGRTGGANGPTFTTDIIQDSPASPAYPVTTIWHYRTVGDSTMNWSSTNSFYPDSGPGALVPEAPLAILLPIAGVAVMGGVAFFAYRRQRRTASDSLAI